MRCRFHPECLRWLRAALLRAPVLPSLVLGAALLGGCRSEEPRPIEPARTAEEFRARSLDDPGLRAWAEPRMPQGAAGFPPKAWDLRALTLTALYFHPDLDVARARIEGALGAEVAAGALPNPTVAGGMKYNFDLPSGVSPWTYEIGIEWPLEFPGKRLYRREEAMHFAEAARLELAEAAWRVYRGVRDAQRQHLLASRAAAGARQRAAALEACEAILQKKLERGAVARPAVQTIAIEVSEARLAAVAAAGKAEESRARLAAATGVPARAIASIRLADDGLDSLPPVDDRRCDEGLASRLDLRRALAEYDAAEAALRLQLLGQYPDLRLMPGYEWEEGEKRFLLGAAIELPLLDRNEGPILEALARRKEVGARFVALQATAIGEIDASRAAFASALGVLEEAGRALAAQETAEREMRRAVDLGAEDPLELARARARTAVSRLARLEALGGAWAALGKLEDAAGRPLDPSFEMPESPPSSAEAGQDSPEVVGHEDKESVP